MTRAGELPELLTVEEAAAVLRVGRTKAYAMAREWRATNGRSGLPVLDLGSVLRVPLHRLEAMVGGQLHAPALMQVPRDASVATAPEHELERSPRQVVTEPAPRPTASRRPAARGRHKVDPRQLSLMPAEHAPVVDHDTIAHPSSSDA